MKNISISVVLPAYNEEKNIKTTLESIFLFLPKHFSNFEIIVVDDGSLDKTGEIVEEISQKNSFLKLVTHPTNMGYGSALKRGFELAVCDYVFLMDSDGQFDINEMTLLVDELSTDNDTIVIGYRKKRADHFIRTVNQFLFNLYIRSLFKLDVKDIDCAFKIFPRKNYKQIRPLVSEGALLSTELLVKFKNAGLRFKQVAVTHYPREHGTPTGANITVILKMIIESLKLKIQTNKLKS